MLRPMRILGIDPGLLRTGYGLIDCTGSRSRHVASGVIRIATGSDLPTRLRHIFEGIHEVIAQHRPDTAAIEQVFVNVNPRSTLLLGQARGAAIVALASNGMAVAEYGATQIKQAVTGHGRATKEQVQRLVTKLLALDTEPAQDAADALACALCHAHGGLAANALGAAALRQRRQALGLVIGDTQDGPPEPAVDALMAATILRRRGRFSAAATVPMPPALAALGLQWRRGRLVKP
jgi:crossover junction endodeoxyribonuclease RuvC